MAMLRRLLLLPLLSPLLAVLLLAAANPSPPLSLRLLTWRSPALPLGGWLAIGAAGGVALGAGASGLAGGGGRSGGAAGRRGAWQERRRVDTRENEPWDGEEPQRVASPRWERAASAGPSRPVDAPPPTMSVPFRVVRQARPASTAARPASTEAGAEVAEMVSDDGWGSASADEW